MIKLFNRADIPMGKMNVFVGSLIYEFKNGPDRRLSIQVIPPIAFKAEDSVALKFHGIGRNFSRFCDQFAMVTFSLPLRNIILGGSTDS